MKRGSQQQEENLSVLDHLSSEIRGFLLLIFSLFILLSLSFFEQDLGQENLLGTVGHAVAWWSLYLFGLLIYPMAGLTGYLGYRLLINLSIRRIWLKFFLAVLFFSSTAILFSLLPEGNPFFRSLVIVEEPSSLYPVKARIAYYGGYPAYYLYQELPHFNLKLLLSPVGTLLTMFACSLISFMLLFEISLLRTAQKLYTYLEESLRPDLTPSKTNEMPAILRQYKNAEEEIKKKAIRKSIPLRSESENLKSELKEGYTLPPLSLLTQAKKVDHGSIKKDLDKQAAILEKTLASFGIEARVGEIHCGPTILSFEVHPAVGVKVQKIKTLENDLALKLEAKSIRIIAPIPGKAAVGVEIPSPYPQEVGFKEMLHSYKNSSKHFQIPILLGKSVSGEEVVADLTKMPHCLIAGATGSGKSVCINTIIMSILMNASPDEIKLILVDPKKVELTPFSQLPHLIAPVITEPTAAYAALKWIVQEMQFRYELLKQLGMRNIAAFNGRKRDLTLEESLPNPPPEKLHYIVAIIDEFADLMMSTNADLETPIARIAQMARAVGIHLVLATQRPSREVITGLIKANFPTRIAFKVASRVNSQIILDENGAESLLGNGDMLFLPPGTSQLVRSQGVYIRDEDIHRVVSFIEQQRGPNYLISSFEQFAQGLDSLSKESSEGDSLYQRAFEIVTQHNNASTTFLQRKLKIGYARAASLMDELESKGVVSSPDGTTKARKILIRGERFS